MGIQYVLVNVTAFGLEEFQGQFTLAVELGSNAFVTEL